MIREATMAVTLTWLGHASFKIEGSSVVYIDPWKINQESKDGDVILVSHSHQDHWSKSDIKKVRRQDSHLVGSCDVIKAAGEGDLLAPGGVIEFGETRITGTPAYNLRKPFHPRKKQWLGFIIDIDDVRIYYAGDTDHIAEMADLQDIDLALLPVGGKFTMNAAKAASAAKEIQAVQCLPYHWGSIIGRESDARQFAKLAGDTAVVLTPGESLIVGRAGGAA
jgi:L-ascorbate metabolism protein UlaG (beta-lactamase superfamily)